MIFEVGDIVSDIRFSGEYEIKKGVYDTLVIIHEDVNIYTYLLDGRTTSTDEFPVLKLIRRPKKTKTITWYRVFCHHKYHKNPHETDYLHKSEEDFLNYIKFSKSDYYWIKLEPVYTHEYEVDNE